MIERAVKILSIVPPVDWGLFGKKLASPEGFGHVAAFTCSSSAGAPYLWQEHRVILLLLTINTIVGARQVRVHGGD